MRERKRSSAAHRPQSHGSRALNRIGVCLPDQGHGRRHHHRRRRALDNPGDDQRLHARSQSAGHRGDDEQRQPNPERLPRAEAVRQRPRRKQQSGKQERVPVHHPLQSGHASAEVVPHGRPGDIDDHRIERDHEEAEQGDGQRKTAARAERRNGTSTTPVGLWHHRGRLAYDFGGGPFQYRAGSSPYGHSRVLMARRSSMARYPSATWSSGRIRSKTLPGSIWRFQTRSISSGRKRRTGAGPPCSRTCV